MSPKKTYVTPHAKQIKFFQSRARIAVYGGAAGGGKTWSLLRDPLRHIHHPSFRGLILRREAAQIRKAGNLLDAAMQIYPQTGAKVDLTNLIFTWPSGARIQLAGMQHETDKENFQGAEIPFIGFEEATQFTESQFWYMVSRNRGQGVAMPYMRLTCNPDPDSWLRDLLDYWIDAETGFAIPKRDGVIQYIYRDPDSNQIYYDDEPYAFAEMQGIDPADVVSLSFISAKLSDNPTLDKGNPGYRAGLMSMSRIEREQLLDGNWNISAKDGDILRREWWMPWKSTIPPKCEMIIHSYDTGWKDKAESDFTACTVWGLFRSEDMVRECLILMDAWKAQLSVPDLRAKVLEQSKSGTDLIPKRPDLIVVEDKAAGIGLIQELRRANLPVRAFEPGARSKIKRAVQASLLLENGAIYAPFAKSRNRFSSFALPVIDELSIFNGQDGRRDDYVDSCVQVWLMLRDKNLLISTHDEYSEPEAPVIRSGLPGVWSDIND